VRQFGREDLHITVAFLGAVSEASALAAFELADEFPLPMTDITLGAVKPLGAERRPSAFSALLERGREEVELAMTKARPAMWARAGARLDSRPALAHITLARPRPKISATELQHAIAWAQALQLGAAESRLDRIALYTWSEDRSQSLFKIVRSLPLLEVVD
jgi:2'-5' RNA ligase